MDNKTLINELKEIRQGLASATLSVVNTFSEHSETEMALVGLSDVADKIDILIHRLKPESLKYPVDSVPLTDKERFWRSYK